MDARGRSVAAVLHELAGGDVDVAFDLARVLAEREARGDAAGAPPPGLGRPWTGAKSLALALAAAGPSGARAHGDADADAARAAFEALHGKSPALADDVARCLLAIARARVPTRSADGGVAPGPAPAPASSSAAALTKAAVANERRVKDFVFALQGVDGHFVRGDRVALQWLQGSPGDARVLAEAARFGWMYRRVLERVRDLVEGPAPSLVGRSVGHAMAEQLDRYDAFVSELAELTSSLDAGASGGALAQVLSWSRPHTRRLAALWELAESSKQSWRGGALASLLHTHASRGDPVMSSVAEALLDAALAPLRETAERLLETGRLVDPHGEFFVSAVWASHAAANKNNSTNISDPLGDLATVGYRVEPAMVPSFVDPALAQRVASVGWYSLLARAYGGGGGIAAHADDAAAAPREAANGADLDDDDDVEDEEEASDDAAERGEEGRGDASRLPPSHAPAPALAPTQAPWHEAPSSATTPSARFAAELSAQARVRGRAADARLLHALHHTHKLLDHLAALKRVLLLSDGDLAQSLAVHAAPLLDAPADLVTRAEVVGAVEQALRESWTGPSAAALAVAAGRIEVRFAAHEGEAQARPGGRRALGWDAFSLSYRMDAPLTAVITRGALETYERLFTFLWRLKRVQFKLDEAWVEHAALAKSNLGSLELRAAGGYSSAAGRGASGGGRGRGGGLMDALHRAHLVRSEMAHFCAQLRSYVMFEVIETAWEQLLVDLREARSLDDVARAHDAYLADVSARTMVAWDAPLAGLGEAAGGAGGGGGGGVDARGAWAPPLRIASASKSPLAALASGEATLPDEARGLAARVELLLELALKFCRVQHRVFVRLRDEEVLESERRHRDADAEARARLGLPMRSEGEGESEGDGAPDVRDAGGAGGADGALDLVQNLSEQVEALSGDFWETLSELLAELSKCASDNLRFLARSLNLSGYYAAGEG